MICIKKTEKGIHPSYFKELSKDKPIEYAKSPDIAYIPVIQHLGSACKALVEVGSDVLIGTKIAESQGDGFYSAVHSSICGKVKAIERFYHPLAGTVNTIIIQNDGRESKETNSNLPVKTTDLSSEQIINKIKYAGIVGLGGAGFPTHVKLSPPKKNCSVDVLLINGAECEPYLTCDYRLMLEKSEEVVKGIALIKKVLGVSRVVVGIENNKPEAIVKMMAASKIDHEIEVVSLPVVYPQGAEKTLIKSILSREVPSGKLPMDVGVVVQNISTAYAVYESVYNSKPLYERVVCVTGDGIKNPKNLIVKIGTPIKSILDECGGFVGEPGKIIAGGPMMGVTQYTLEIPVIKTMSGILVMSKQQVKTSKRNPCIRCARCVDVCPQNLTPCVIASSADKDLLDTCQEYNILDCVECGCCTYVCPSKIPLVHLVKYAKRKLRLRYERT